MAEQGGKEYEIELRVCWNQKVMVDQRETLDFIQGAVGSNMKKVQCEKWIVGEKSRGRIPVKRLLGKILD